MYTWQFIFVSGWALSFVSAFTNPGPFIYNNNRLVFSPLSFTQSSRNRHWKSTDRIKAVVGQDDAVVSVSNVETTYLPIFDFAEADTVNKIQRIDDAIMGGISTSSVQNVTGQEYARWTGICRTDGG